MKNSWFEKGFFDGVEVPGAPLSEGETVLYYDGPQILWLESSSPNLTYLAMASSPLEGFYLAAVQDNIKNDIEVGRKTPLQVLESTPEGKLFHLKFDRIGLGFSVAPISPESLYL